MPDFDITSALLKTIAVNSLYSAGVRSPVHMAHHITSVMAEGDVARDACSLVETIAAFSVPGRDRPLNLLVFASKFCHFYVDPTHFPILDTFAEHLAGPYTNRSFEYMIEPERKSD